MRVPHLVLSLEVGRSVVLPSLLVRLLTAVLLPELASKQARRRS